MRNNHQLELTRNKVLQTIESLCDDVLSKELKSGRAITQITRLRERTKDLISELRLTYKQLSTQNQVPDLDLDTMTLEQREEYFKEYGNPDGFWDDSQDGGGLDSEPEKIVRLHRRN